MKKRLFIIIGILIALAVAGYFVYGVFATSNPHTWTDGLVGYWSFDGRYTTSTDGTKDVSNNGHYGAFSGGVKPAPGVVGQALTFDGVDDYVDIGNRSPFNTFHQNNKTFSVESWIYYISGQGIIIANNDVGYTTGWSFRVANGATTTIFNVGNANSSGQAVVTQSSAFSPLTNAWHHVAMTYTVASSNYAVNFYLDGVNVGTSTGTGSNFGTGTVTNSLSIGFTNKDIAWAKYYLKGSLDEVRVYTRVLSADEVKQHYDQTRRNLVVNQPSGTPPVGWWKMDEATGATVRDYSVNANNGTVSNGGYGATSTDGQIGKALSFDGVDDYVNAGSGASLVFGTGDFAVGAWFKSSPITSNRMIVSNDNGANQFYSLYLTSAHLLSFMIRDGGSWKIVDSTSVLDDGNWHYGVGLREGNNIKLYVDGVLKDSDTGVDNYNVTETPISIGRKVASTYFNGLIDEVRIYNYARTADQIATDYRAGAYRTIIGTSVPSTWWTDGLVGYWNFDGQNTTSTNGTRDTSGNNNWGAFGTGLYKPKPVAGIVGQALSFDKVDDIISLGKPASLANVFSNGGTLEIWIKPNSMGEGDYGRIVAKANGSNAGWLTSTRGESGGYMQVGLTIYTSSGTTGGWRTTNAVVPIGAWTHFVLTYNSSQVATDPIIYLNGQSVAVTETGTPTGTYGSDTNQNAYIGNEIDYSRTFDGLMDEVRIYNRALGADEVMMHYQQTRRNLGI